MLSPLSAASVNPAGPASLAPQSMAPRPDDPSQGKALREIGSRFDPVRPTDPTRSGDIRPSLATWEPDPIRPSPATTALFEARNKAASGDDEEAPVLRPGLDDARTGPTGTGPRGWEPETFRPGPSDASRLEKPALAATNDDEEALARPAVADSGDDEEAIALRPDFGAPAPGKTSWEPETFRPGPSDAARFEKPSLAATNDDEEALARPSPLETAAYQQAVKGYAQLGSYAAIQWKLNMAA